MDTQTKIDLARYETARVHLCKAIEYFAKDIKYELKNKTTNHYPTFKEFKVLQISKEGCARTIYKSAKLNQKARAWHDSIHMDGDFSFSVEHEKAVARIQRQQVLECLQNLDISEEVCMDSAQLIYLDIAIQAEWYERMKSFLHNQEATIKEYFLLYIKENP